MTALSLTQDQIYQQLFLASKNIYEKSYECHEPLIIENGKSILVKDVSPTTASKTAQGYAQLSLAAQRIYKTRTKLHSHQISTIMPLPSQAMLPNTNVVSTQFENQHLQTYTAMAVNDFVIPQTSFYPSNASDISIKKLHNESLCILPFSSSASFMPIYGIRRMSGGSVFPNGHHSTVDYQQIKFIN